MMRLFRRKPAAVPRGLDVRTMRLQCEACGVPVDVVERVGSAAPAVVYRPCGHVSEEWKP